jgi:hypothetical protein
MSATLTSKFEDVYPLTPFQQGVLFHVLDTPNAGMYLNQQRYTLRGNLDLAAFKNALQAVMNRHQIFRTVFLLSGLNGPHQVVYRRVNLPWVMHDWSACSPAEAETRLNAFLRSDYQSGFDLKRMPLSRATLIRMGRTLYVFVWSFHLLLMDGWSMQIILKDLLTLYHSFHTGQFMELDPPLPYREFIKWQQQQTEGEAEAYWRKTLAGFSSPTPLVVDRTPPEGVSNRPNFREQYLVLDEATTNNLRAFISQHRLTLNILLQGAWALLLSRRSATNDVVFGNAVSGRSAVIPRIDSAVGLYVNVLPVRVIVRPDKEVVPWLQDLQKQQGDSLRYEYCSLVSIHGWSDVPRNQPLFESCIIFQNYPNGVAVPESTGVKVVHIGVTERTNVPLVLIPNPATQLDLKIVYMGSRFDEATIADMLEKLRRILIDLTKNSQATLSSISYQVAAERQFLIESFNQSLASV